MKKKALIIVSFVILAGLVGLVVYVNQVNEKAISNEKQNNTEETSKKDVREVVWEQLSSRQKESVDGTWRDGKVAKVTLGRTAMIGIEDKSYQGKEAYMIDFPTKNKGVPNNMIVYADVNTYEYIGDGPVD